MYLCDIFMKFEVIDKICVTNTIALVQYIATYPSQMQSDRITVTS